MSSHEDLIIRSLFSVHQTDDKEKLLENFFLIYQSKFDFTFDLYVSIYTIIKSFILENKHVPDLYTLKVILEKNNNQNLLDILNIICTQPLLYQGDLKTLVDFEIEDKNTDKITSLLKEASEINTTGIQVKEGREEITLKGPKDALKHVMRVAHDMSSEGFNSKLKGDIVSDTSSFKEEYIEAKENPNGGYGQYTGLAQIDKITGGAKKYELWTHAAFTGHLKSTFAMNWAYTQAIYMGHSSFYYSLEMPYVQLRRIIVGMHSYHEKFNSIRMSLGLQKNKNISTSLDYNFLKYGKLDDRQERFLFEHVLPDLEDKDNGYGQVHVECGDPDKEAVTLGDIKFSAEMLYSKVPFKTIFIDHLLLVSGKRHYPSTTERLNEVVRDSKNLALRFNHGEGIAVVALFQTSREGYKAAQKKDGLYDLTALSWCSEIERSSDIVTATWLTEELSKSNRVQFQCLKSRDQQPFTTFKAKMEWPCRRMVTCYDSDESIEENTNQQLDKNMNVDDLLSDV